MFCRSVFLFSFCEKPFLFIAINKKVKFDGARCLFSTFLCLQGDHHCACAQKWCHFSFFPRAFKQKNLRLRLHVSRYPDIWISGSQRSGYLRGVYTYRIETFSAFTRVQISGCNIRGILAMCRRNTQMPFFFVKLHVFKFSSIFSFLF